MRILQDLGLVMPGELKKKPMSEAIAMSPGKVDQGARMMVEIGGCSFGLWCERDIPVALDPEHAPFVVPITSGGPCDIEMEISWCDHLELPGIAPNFDSGGLWSSYTSELGTKFYFTSSSLGPSPYKAAWFDLPFRRGHVVLNRPILSALKQIYPLEYPLDELVMMHRLALGEGVEVHALGLADEDGSGYLFVGHSGAGKSTTARLWMAHAGVHLLSDDRIILRKHDDQYWMYGTPWHGDAGVASQGKAPLSAIFLLEQAPRNEVRSVSALTAASELFARAFLPHYLVSGIEFTLDFLHQITRSIPCFVLRFTPTQDAVEAVRYACV
jgi:hypothetical protein